MSDETLIDPAGARSGALRLTRAGDALLSAATDAATRIAGLHAGTPWGTDHYGTTFNQNYLEGEHRPAALVWEEGMSHVHLLADLGPDVLAGVEGTVSDDELISSWFGQE